MLFVEIAYHQKFKCRERERESIKHWIKSTATIHNALTRELCQVQHKTSIIDDPTLILHHATSITCRRIEADASIYTSSRNAGRLSRLTLNVTGLQRIFF
jgi:hypothetical protein